MFAISFDMNIAELEANYGSPYNPAYYEIKRLLKNDGFLWSDLTAILKES